MNLENNDCPVTLFNHQVNHVKNIWNLIVDKGAFSYLDTSEVGTGKTVTSLMIAWWLQKIYKIKVMIVAPSELSLNNDDGWLKWAETFGVNVDVSITYSKLIGSKSRKTGKYTVKHPWLIPNNDKKKWETSPEFEQLCAYGVFIIFDESHKTKNQSITHYACAALVRTAKKYRKRSRVALLSFTPGDKSVHYPQILRMSGLVTSLNLYHHVPFTSEYEWEDYGFGEMVRIIRKLDKSTNARNKIEEAMVKISAARAANICKELYDQYIGSLITFAMPKPKTEYKRNMMNAFLDTDEASLELINEGIMMLTNAVKWDGDDVGDRREWSLGGITNGLKRIEQGKLMSIARYVRKQSKKFPNKKFVICCGARDTRNHTFLQKILYKEYCMDSIKNTLYELRKTNKLWKNVNKDIINLICDKYMDQKVYPDILNGKIKKKDRVNIVKKFQQNNNNKWCLIMSPGVGSESISLGDKHGDHPREMLIIPDYYFGRVVQSTGRIDRVGVKSDVKVMLVYSRQGMLETNILNSMIRKTKTARALLAEGQDVRFPGEYPFTIFGKKDEQYHTLKNELENLQRNT